MSARSRAKARDAQLLADIRISRGQQPVSLGRVGADLERFAVGLLNVTVPVVKPGMAEELRRAVIVRRRAFLEAACPECGSVWHVRSGRVVVPHSSDCSADARNIEALAERCGAVVVARARW